MKALDWLLNLIAPTPKRDLLVPVQVPKDAFILKSATLAQSMPPSINNKPLFNEWNTKNAIKEGLKQSDYVYACARKVSESLASVPIVTVDADTGALVTVQGWRTSE